MFRNPFDQAGRWHKANLHTHTTVSDGKASLEERIEQYRGHGYSVLAITDHGVPGDAACFSTEDFLVLDGVELSVPGFAEGRIYHLVCVNTPPGFAPPDQGDANDIIAAAKAAGAETFIAHPYWNGNNVRDLSLLKGYAGMEVFNASCRGMGKPNSSVHWDNMLELGLRVAGIGADDTHGGREDPYDLFGAYTMLRLPELTLPAVMDALGSGCYYASCGPEILDFRVEGDRVCVRCSEAKSIRLMAWRSHGRSLHAGEGPLLTELETQLDEKWKYVRAEVVDVHDRGAWTNPISL